MFGYQRSASYGTAIERILYGSFTEPSKSNAVLVKVIYTLLNYFYFQGLIL